MRMLSQRRAPVLVEAQHLHPEYIGNPEQLRKVKSIFVPADDVVSLLSCRGSASFQASG
jgi:hypothetical protein